MNEYVVPAVLFLAGLLVLHVLVKFLVPYAFPAFLVWFSKRYNEAMTSFKQELFKDMETLRENLANGKLASDEKPSLTVLEIGVGTGANFKFYPECTAVIAVEPNKNFVGYLEKCVAEHFPRVRLQRTVIAYGENLRGHVEDCSVDAVVCTLVLCTVRDIDAVLSEAKRALKPGGKFFYLEHVAGEPGAFVSRLQWFLNPLWSYIYRGCQLMRTPWINVERAGFSKTDSQRFLAPLNLGAAFFPVEPHAMGVATK